MSEKPTIARVVVFQNGMVMVFDERGEQVPEFQGAWVDVKERIAQNTSTSTSIERGVNWTAKIRA